MGLCCFRYLRWQRRSATTFTGHSLAKSQSSSSVPTSPINHSSSIENNPSCESAITIEEKQSSTHTAHAAVLPITSSYLCKNENFVSNEYTDDLTRKHDYVACLQLGSSLIDRPIGTAIQPLPFMGRVLMKFNTFEQHWIKPDA